MLARLLFLLPLALAGDPPSSGETCGEPLARVPSGPADPHETLVPDPRAKRPREIVEDRLRKMGITGVDGLVGRRAFRGGVAPPPSSPSPEPVDDAATGGCSSDGAPPE